MSATTLSYLSARVAETSTMDEALAAEWAKVEDLYTRRLWHQLTVHLLTFINHSSFSAGGLVDMYDNLIKDIEDRIKPLSLVTMVRRVIEEKADVAASIAFLEPIKEKVKKDPLAILSFNTTIAELRLSENDYEKAEELLKQCEEELGTEAGVTPVHADFYRVSAAFKKFKGKHAEFYSDALRYLGCVDMATLGDQEKADRAFDLGLAALLGKGIYNVGELLAHDVIDALRGTDKQWLVDMLTAFNSGNVAAFKALKSSWGANGDLAAYEPLLLEKFQLLAVMEVVFQRGTKERRVPFSVVAEASQVAANEVELLVMKALSLKLVRGSINQITETIDFTWVQPRVLDKAQLGVMHAKLGEWLLSVDKASGLMDAGAPELMASE